MGGAFSPDGTKIAATLSQDGNSEIYLLSRDGAVLKRLTNNPLHRHLAVVVARRFAHRLRLRSLRLAADLDDERRRHEPDHASRRRGNYNQTPSWTPRKDVSLIAFTARDEKYNYDIFTINADTGEILRITEGHGSNQHPSWAPNGRAIAYESSRGGVWISTFDGRTERQVYKGAASSPAWSPLLGR